MLIPQDMKPHRSHQFYGMLQTSVVPIEDRGSHISAASLTGQQSDELRSPSLLIRHTCHVTDCDISSSRDA